MYSKTLVNQAGEKLCDNPQNEEAVEILEYWRSVHVKPLVAVRSLILDALQQTPHHGEEQMSPPETSLRLKRADSIIRKLKRFPTMNLSRMQDIAGIRVVWDSPSCSPQQTLVRLNEFFIRCQKRLAQEYRIKKIDHYIDKPRTSGYRAVHIVTEYQDQNDSVCNGLQIELQLRTACQHLWAMAVETVGMFYGEALKASRGNQDWLDFFKLCSAAISHREGSAVVAELAQKTFDEIRKELRYYGKEKTFFTKLAAIKEVDEIVAKTMENEYDYWLLELNIKKGKNEVYGFRTDQLDTANAMYTAKEQTPACVRGDRQVVLVSAQSFKDLHKAYPSFFLDVAEFTEMIRGIIE